MDVYTLTAHSSDDAWQIVGWARATSKPRALELLGEVADITPETIIMTTIAWHAGKDSWYHNEHAEAVPPREVAEAEAARAHLSNLEDERNRLKARCERLARSLNEDRGQQLARTLARILNRAKTLPEISGDDEQRAMQFVRSQADIDLSNDCYASMTRLGGLFA